MFKILGQAKRATLGYMKIKRTIVSLSPACQMIKSVTLVCWIFGKYPEPEYKLSIKEKSKCPNFTKMVMVVIASVDLFNWTGFTNRSRLDALWLATMHCKSLSSVVQSQRLGYSLICEVYKDFTVAKRKTKRRSNPSLPYKHFINMLRCQ